MKKILIVILTILIIVLIVFTLTKGIAIGNFKVYSIKDIKNKSNDLDNSLATANDLTKKIYPSKLEEINSAIKSLTVSKEKYEAKTKYMSENQTLGVVEVKSYKIEFLWVIIENYAKEQGLVLKMDIENSNSEGVYNLNFTLTGVYTGITQFIYDLENDDGLEFEIKNLIITPIGVNTGTSNNTQNTNTNTTANNVTNTSTNATANKSTTKNTTVTTVDGKNLQATFRVENIGIEF